MSRLYLCSICRGCFFHRGCFICRGCSIHRGCLLTLGVDRADPTLSFYNLYYSLLSLSGIGPCSADKIGSKFLGSRNLPTSAAGTMAHALCQTNFCFKVMHSAAPSAALCIQARLEPGGPYEQRLRSHGRAVERGAPRWVWS